MALFGKNKKEDTKAAAVESVESSVSEKKDIPKKKQITPKLAPERDLATVLVRPRITEKAVLGTDRNMYTFEVKRDATKHDVRDAVRNTYDVTPVKINIVNKKPRHYVSRLRGRKMLDSGLKKAYVYLKEGDRIDLV